MNKKVIIENFKLSWRNAIESCKLIFDGLTDVLQQKLFVSSLQNAIELGCKQILIDESDYRVVDYGNKKMDVQTARKYLNSDNLNDFFAGLTKDEIEKIASITFSELIEIFSSKLKSISGLNFKKENLTLLKKLRNSETHFYLDKNSFITPAEFKQLCELIATFQSYFESKNLIHLNTNDDEEESLDTILLSNYKFPKTNFNSLIINSTTNNTILNLLPKYNDKDLSSGLHYEMVPEEDEYKLAYYLYLNLTKDDKKKVNLTFIEFFRRFKLMKRLNLINVAYENSFEELSDVGFAIDNKLESVGYQKISTVITAKR